METNVTQLHVNPDPGLDTGVQGENATKYTGSHDTTGK